MDTGLACFWPMTQSLGPSLSAMGSSAPHPAAETRKAREEQMELSHTDQGLSFTGSFSPSVHQPLLLQGDHMLWTAQHQRLLDRLSLSLPLPAHFLTPTSPCSRRGPDRHQTRVGRMAEREEATLGSQRALSGLRRGRGVDI